MIARLFHIAPFSVVLLHLSTAFVLELDHHHGIVAAGGGTPLLGPHACGTTEHHIAVDQLQSCRSCILQLQRQTIPPAVNSDDGFMQQGFPAPAVRVALPQQRSSLQPESRGPPSA